MKPAKPPTPPPAIKTIKEEMIEEIEKQVEILDKPTGFISPRQLTKLKTIAEKNIKKIEEMTEKELSNNPEYIHLMAKAIQQYTALIEASSQPRLQHGSFFTQKRGDQEIDLTQAPVKIQSMV